MTTKPQAAPAVKAKAAKARPELQVECCYRRDDGVMLVLITVGKDLDYYRVVPVPSEIGPAYHFDKLGGTDEGHDVCLTPNGHCDCKGWLHRGYCRHVQALLTLWSRGELDTRQHAAALLARHAGRPS